MKRRTFLRSLAAGIALSMLPFMRETPAPRVPADYDSYMALSAYRFFTG